MSETLISALAWVRKGYAASNPKEYELLEEEVEIMKQDPSIQSSIQQAKKIQQQADQEKSQVQGKKQGSKKEEKKINGQEEWQENDFEEGDDEFDDGMPVFTSEFAQMKHGMPDVDENGYQFAVDEISNEDKEDYMIRTSDALIVAAKIEKEFSSLEVYVYEQEKNCLFVHHEITLSAFPLALEWLPLNPTTFQGDQADQGNFVIVGTFLPEIEIWNLDVINAIEPTMILGGELDEEEQQLLMMKQQQQKSKKGKKVKHFNQLQKQQLFKEGSHTDAVLCLNLNSFRPNILVSGSADQTVKLWDLSSQKNVHTFSSHENKVQVCQWNPFQDSVLMSGGYDKKIILQDVRQPQNPMQTTLTSEIESGGWVPNDENLLYVSTEDGYVSVLDARKFSSKNKQDQYVIHFQAHEKQTTSVSFNSLVPGMISTTSMDKTVKIFDLQNVTKKTPKFVTQKSPNAGGLFCGNFYKDSAFVFACGNGNGELFVWDTAEDRRIVETFGSRVSENIRPTLDNCTVGDSILQYPKPDSDDSDDDDAMYQENQQIQEE